MTVPASSDLYVTPSFSNSAVYSDAVDSSSAGSVTFTDASFETSEYSSGHFLLIEEGPLVGRMFTITANDATTLTLEDADDELSAADTHQVSIVPALTLGGLFPSGLGGKSEVNPGNPDIILFFNDNTAGVEGFFPESIYYHSPIGDAPGWRRIGSPLDESRDDDALPLGQGFVVRNNSGLDVSFYLFGEVLQAKVGIPIHSSSEGATDNLVGAPRPLSIALGELGLSGDGGIIETTTVASEVKDTVRIFLNSGSGQDKEPDSVYCLFSDGWRKVVDGVVVTSGSTFEGDLIPASAALVVRKVATSQSETVYWTNSWDLPAQS